jgi:hypothetical protein
MKVVTALLDRIFAAAGALLLAQMPMFMVQYSQQLAGRSGELGLQLDAIRRIASDSGKSLPQYIDKFVAAGDPDFTRQGELIHQMATRYQFLLDSETQLSEASPFAKPFIFMQQLDWEVAHSTWQHFQFGIPFNLEGLTYALIGLVGGCLLFLILNRLFWFILGLSKRSKTGLEPS